MSYIAVGAAGAKLISGAITSAVAKKKRKKAEAEQDVQTAAQMKSLKAGTAAQQMAELDLGRELEGQAGYNPEAAYAKNQVERGAATNIERGARAGGSVAEMMNYASALTGKSQLGVQSISARENTRRNQLKAAAKGQKIKSAAIGREGIQQEFALTNQGRQNKLQQGAVINQNAANTNDYISGALGDIGSYAMMSKMTEFGGDGTGSDLGEAVGNLLNKRKRAAANRRSARNVSFDPQTPNMSAIYSSPIFTAKEY